jgi:type II secretory pathway component PulK
VNFNGFHLRANNKSGIILIVVLWILVILSVLAIGLGRTARIDLALTKHRIGKLKADFLIWGAVNYAMNQIRLGAENQPPAEDTLYQCGFVLKDGKTSEDLFKNVKLKDGAFDISYILRDDQGRDQVCYGFQDEERRINLNGIHKGNDKILKNLFVLLKIDERKAEDLAAQIVDWQDADSEKMDEAHGAEKEEYLSLPKPYPCKNAPLESLDELLLIKDMTPEIFSQIKEYVTIFPQNSALNINVNTASDVALKAVFRFVAEQSPGVENEDVDSLVGKIIAYRSGKDGIPCTADDRAIKNSNISPVGLNSQESAFYMTAANNYFKGMSDYFRVCAKATDSQYQISSRAEAVIAKENLSLLFWKRK